MKRIQKNVVLGICLSVLILCSMTVAVRAADVSLYAVYKRQIYQQTGINPPVLQPVPYVFNAIVELASSNSVTGATLASGTNRPAPLQRWYENEFLPFRWIYGAAEGFPTQAALDLARPDGNYTFSIAATNDGLKSLTLNLTGDAYPPVPYIQNSLAAQTVDATSDFVVQWNAYAGGTTNDIIFVSVRRLSDGNAVFSTPFLETPGSLNGTATSVVIPAGTLQPGQSYDAYVRFDNILTQDTTSYPGAVGSASYARGTHFSLRTLPPPAPTNLPTLVSIFSPDPIVSAGTNSWSYRTKRTGANPATFVVRRNGTNDDLTVYYATGGTATNGVNYELLPGAATIPAGQHTAGITVVPITSTTPPPSPIETVILTLQSSTNVPPEYALGRPARAEAIIVGKSANPRAGWLGDGSFHGQLCATNGSWFEVDESTNLTDWSAICTNAIDGGAVNFVDPDAGNSGQRHYRAVPVPAPPQ